MIFVPLFQQVYFSKSTFVKTAKHWSIFTCVVVWRSGGQYVPYSFTPICSGNWTSTFELLIVSKQPFWSVIKFCIKLWLCGNWELFARVNNGNLKNCDLLNEGWSALCVTCSAVIPSSAWQSHNYPSRGARTGCSLLCPVGTLWWHGMKLEVHLGPAASWQQPHWDLCRVCLFGNKHLAASIRFCAGWATWHSWPVVCCSAVSGGAGNG